MGNLKRDYLNHEEKNFYMIIKSVIQMIQGDRNLDNKCVGKDVWEDWKERDMITPTMQKSIKTAYTNMKKFCYELEDNLSTTQMNNLNKQIQKFDFKIIDEFTISKFMRSLDNNLKYAVIEREKFEPILQDIAAVRCVGCKCNYEKCPLFKMLDDINTPYCGEEPNCPYAANLDEFTDEEIKNLQRLKDIVNGRHSLTKEFERKVEYEDNVVKKSIGSDRICIPKNSKKAKQRSKRGSTKKNRK